MNFIKTIFNLFYPNKYKEADDRNYEWCIVGNVVDKHFWGEEKIIKRGNKQFRPNAKVYCMPEFVGMAHESMRVLGKPRKQKRLINIIIDTKKIKNFRLQKVYNPKIQSIIGSHVFYLNNRKSKEEIKNLKKMITYFNTLSEEIN